MTRKDLTAKMTELVREERAFRAEQQAREKAFRAKQSADLKALCKAEDNLEKPKQTKTAKPVGDKCVGIGIDSRGFHHSITDKVKKVLGSHIGAKKKGTAKLHGAFSNALIDAIPPSFSLADHSGDADSGYFVLRFKGSREEYHFAAYDNENTLVWNKVRIVPTEIRAAA